MWKLVLYALLITVIGATAAGSHEQQATVGGKRVQPTAESIAQKLKEHEAVERQKKRSLPPSNHLPRAW